MVSSKAYRNRWMRRVLLYSRRWSIVSGLQHGSLHNFKKFALLFEELDLIEKLSDVTL